VGVVPNKGVLGFLAKNSDGVVAFDSAHLDKVSSEIVVSADHSTVQRHPLTVLEVRRVLLEHLHSIQPANAAAFRSSDTAFQASPISVFSTTTATGTIPTELRQNVVAR
jgi:hypothetical protein